MKNKDILDHLKKVRDVESIQQKNVRRICAS